MDALQMLGSALGLGFLAGIRLYLTVFLLGLAMRFGWFHLHEHFASLAILGDWRILTASGAASLCEFFADKVAWVDSVWDTVHTVIRPVGAVVLATAAFGDVDPVWKVVLVLLSGSLALTSHSSKAATRFLANHSPEPFSNIALSLAGDAVVPVGLWLINTHPGLVIGLVLAFAAVFAWLAPRVGRLLRIQANAATALWRKHVQHVRGAGATGLNLRMDPVVFQIFGVHGNLVSSLPDRYRAHLEPELGGLPRVPAIRCAATKSVPGLRSSIGYLCTVGHDLVFLTHRGLRYRTFRIPLQEIQRVDYDHNILLDRLWLYEGNRVLSFDVFKAPFEEKTPVQTAAAVGR